MKFKIILIVASFMILECSVNAQSQSESITIKKYIFGPTNYFQEEKKVKYKELSSIVKPNPTAYNLMLDAKKTRNWGLGLNVAALTTFTLFWAHVVNTAAKNPTTAVVVPIIIDQQGLILMVSSFTLLFIGKSKIEKSRKQTINSIKVYNDGLATSANLYKINLGITQNGVGVVLKF